MTKTLQQELADFQSTLDQVRKQYAEDGTITADAQSHLDVLEGKIKRLRPGAGSPARGLGGGLPAAPGRADGNAPMPGMEGMDTGQVQAQLAQVGQQLGQKLWNWITEKGVTTVVIENLTSKVLRLKGKDLIHKKQSKWIDYPPTEIIAAKSPHDPTRETIKVETKGFFRSVTSADTSGWVEYEIEDTWRKETLDGKKQPAKHWVRAVWSRKGKGEFADFIESKGTITSLARHKIEVQQVKDGTIIYRFSEDAPDSKSKDPQPPADPKPKDQRPPAEPKLKKPLEFTIKPFTVRLHDKLDKGDLKQRAHEIWNDKSLAEIKRAILEKLPAGKLKIEVHGYTSNTDTADRNLDLSKRRALAVIAALQKVGVPETAFTEPQPHGEWETESPTDDKKQENEDDEWRKVVVKIFQ
jgi:outer membrane protein OmpA-like peptidoglycan-associated protein